LFGARAETPQKRRARESRTVGKVVMVMVVVVVAVMVEYGIGFASGR
jgi:hypothetical protein